MTVARLKVGVQFHPQHASVAELRHAWAAADEMGIDSIWVWDHFFPLYGGRGAVSLAAGVARRPDVTTSRGRCSPRWRSITANARIGVLISNINFRNPDLLADMARTVDHLSGGRVILGIGAGNIERDFREYGYSFASGPDRLRALEEGIRRVKRRLKNYWTRHRPDRFRYSSAAADGRSHCGWSPSTRICGTPSGRRRNTRCRTPP